MKRNDKWKFRRVWQIQVDDKLYSINQTELNVDSITNINNGWIDVCSINVENIDNYFSGGILAHNK